MKRLLGTLIAATLVLSACSQTTLRKMKIKSQKILLKRNLTIKRQKLMRIKVWRTKEISRKKNNKSMQESATNEQVQSQQQTNNNQQQYSDEYLANNSVSNDDQLSSEEQQKYNENTNENKQNSHVDLNSLPATDFRTDWMSESGQKQVNDLANQKIAVKFHNTNLMIAYLM